MEYTREPVPATLPGLTEPETQELYHIQVEGAMYGYHSLSDDKLHRFRELQAKVDS